MIIASLIMSPKSDKRQSVVEVLLSVQTIASLKPGCLHCDIYEEYGHGQKILYLEKWQTKEDMYKHIGSNLYLRVLNAIELSTEPPEIFFHEGPETMGIELIKTIRTTRDKSEDA